MKRWTAVYVRVSTAEQRVDSQELELRRYCEQRGWSDAKFYMDRICGDTSSRPELDAMMKDVRAGRAVRVVCYKLDRLGRSLTHLALMLDELNRLKVPLIASSQGIDTSDSNPAGRLQVNVLMAIAQFERELIRERVNVGVAAAKARGVKLGRPAKLRARAPEVMKLRGQGEGIRAIARSLQMPVSSVHAIIKFEKQGWAAMKQAAGERVST